MDLKRKSIYALLIKLQLSKEFFGSGRKKRKEKVRSAAGTVIVYVLLGALIAGSFGGMFYGIIEFIGSIGYGWIYMGLMSIMILMFSFFMTVFLIYSQLFESKDNDLLLSMPIKPRAILVSRVIGLLVMSYGTGLLIAIPGLFVYMRSIGLSALGLVFFFLEVLLIPMLALTLSMFIGWLVGTVVSNSRHKKLLQTVLTLIGLAIYLVFYINLTSGMEDMLSKAIQNADGIKKSIPFIYHFGNAITNADIKSFLIAAATCIIPFAIACYLVSLNFNKVLIGNKGAKKIEYKAGRMASSSKMLSMIKLEFSRLFSSPSYIMNGLMGLVMIVVIPIVVIIRINSSEEEVIEGVKIGEMLGTFEITTPIVTMMILFMMSFAVVSGVAMSLDAKTLWIQKSGPIKGEDIIISKAMPQLLISIPFLIASSIIIEVFLKLSAVNYVLMTLIIILGGVFNSLWGSFIGAKFPKLDWLTETEAIKRGKGALLAMVTCMAFPAAFILAFWLLRKIKFYSTIPFMIVMLVTYLIAAVGTYLIIKKKGQELVDRILY